ncbi:MAG: hypothetical protein H7843_09240 [Nitrospirota bacterium]
MRRFFQVVSVVLCVLIIAGNSTGWDTINKPKSNGGGSYDNLSAIKTDNITEGTTNLFYTNTRARSAISGLGLIGYNSGTGAISLNTTTTNKWLDGTGNYFSLYSDNITEGNKLYWSQSRFNTAFSGMTTDNLSQGTGNLYFTNAAARAALSAAAPLSYNSTTGAVSIAGVTSTPVKGQLLIGNDNGTFGLNTLSAGSNITITNDNNSITIAASGGGGGGGTWGGITGTLSAQSDLQNALNAKEPSFAATTSGNWYNGTKNWFTLYTDNITQGTNLWFTNSAARTALSAGTGISYDNTTGVITATGGGGGGGSIGSIDNFTLTTNQSGQAQVANWVINDIILAYFKLAVHAALTIFNLDDGIFDKFENQAGIDNRTVAWSDNVTYDSVNHLYRSSNSNPASKNICGKTYDGLSPFMYTNGGTAVNRGVYNACDNTTTAGTGDFYVTTFSNPTNILIDFATKRTVTAYNMNCINADTTCPNTWTFSGSGDNISWTTLSTVSGVTSWNNTTKAYSIANPGSYNHYRLNFTANNGGTSISLNEMQVISIDPIDYYNMTITSAPYTAPFNPTKARLIFIQQDNTTQGIILNTDLKAYVSSDNGTSWTQVTLAKDDVIQAGTSSTPAWNLLSGDATLAGSNNQMRWRLMTFNNDNVTNKGTAVRAAAVLVVQ